jgi:dTDP-glucose 4,6-dehydratase
VYNIRSGEEWTNPEVARRILVLAGQAEALSAHVKDCPDLDRRYAIDHSNVTRGLGWTPRIPFEEGLRSPIDCYRSHEAWWRVILSGDYQVYYQCQYGDHVGN